MKPILYESSGGALDALLLTNVFVYCDLYTYTLADSSVLRYATSDVDITYGGHTWSSAAPFHGGLGDVKSGSGNPPAGHWKTGLDVDTWQVEVAPRLSDPITGAAYPDKIGVTPWLQAVRGGALDGAILRVDRAYFPSWSNSATAWGVNAPTGVLTIFLGRIAAIDITRTAALINANDFRELLTIGMPRNVYGASCRHVLYDVGCTLTAASFAVTSSVLSGSSQNIVYSNAAAPPGSATFARGQIVMTSGANNGFRRLIRDWVGGSPGTFTLIAPFYYTLSPGDTFTAYAGCDKTFTTCTAFSNTANFGGQRYIPAPETAV